MMHHQNFLDLLFKSQGNDSVYIDDYKVPQTSVKGIRFLYKQFNLRKSGVILNEADRFCRNTQVCLFLRAVRPLLSRPVLILCQEGYQYCWLGRFDALCTKIINDVTIETENPYLKKKMVIINTMVNLHKFCEREWSIIIVDGDEVTSPNPILKLPFKACFKIWNTEVNMKENLDRFEEAYKWTFPREIFDKHFFIPEPGNAVDVIEKSILLDSFLEEMVLKRKDSTPSHENHVPERRTENIFYGPNGSSSMILGNTTIRLANPTPKETPMIVGDTIITRTKVDPVAGSSRIIGDTSISSTSTTSSTAAFKTIRETNITPNTDYIMSVCDTSITATNAAPTTVTPTKNPVPTVMISKKNKDATGTKIKRSKPRIEPDNVPTKLFESPMAVLAKLLEESPKTEPEEGKNRIDYCIENFSKINGKDNGLEPSNMESVKDEIRTDKLIEITELAEKPDVASQVAGDKLVEMDTLVFGHDTLISQVSDNDIPGKENNTATDKKETEPHTILTCKPVGERTTNNKLFTDNNKSTSSITYKTSARCSEKGERDEKNDRKKLKCKSLRSEEPKDIIEIDLDELNKEMRALVTRDEPDRLAKRQKTVDSSQTATCFDEIKNKFNGHNKETSHSGNKLTEQIVNSLKRNNIDVEMKECEETVSKKFKGSFLDRLF